MTSQKDVWEMGKDGKTDLRTPVCWDRMTDDKPKRRKVNDVDWWHDVRGNMNKWVAYILVTIIYQPKMYIFLISELCVNKFLITIIMSSWKRLWKIFVVKRQNFRREEKTEHFRNQKTA